MVGVCSFPLFLHMNAIHSVFPSVTAVSPWGTEDGNFPGVEHSPLHITVYQPQICRQFSESDAWLQQSELHYFKLSCLTKAVVLSISLGTICTWERENHCGGGGRWERWHAGGQQVMCLPSEYLHMLLVRGLIDMPPSAQIPHQPGGVRGHCGALYSWPKRERCPQTHMPGQITTSTMMHSLESLEPCENQKRQAGVFRKVYTYSLRGRLTFIKKIWIESVESVILNERSMCRIYEKKGNVWSLLHRMWPPNKIVIYQLKFGEWSQLI